MDAALRACSRGVDRPDARPRVRAPQARCVKQPRRRHIGDEAAEPSQEARILVAPDRCADQRGLLSDVDDRDDRPSALRALVHRVDGNEHGGVADRRRGDAVDRSLAVPVMVNIESSSMIWLSRIASALRLPCLASDRDAVKTDPEPRRGGHYERFCSGDSS